MTHESEGKSEVVATIMQEHPGALCYISANISEQHRAPVLSLLASEAAQLPRIEGFGGRIDDVNIVEKMYRQAKTQENPAAESELYPLHMDIPERLYKLTQVNPNYDAKSPSRPPGRGVWATEAHIDTLLPMVIQSWKEMFPADPDNNIDLANNHEQQQLWQRRTLSAIKRGCTMWELPAAAQHNSNNSNNNTNTNTKTTGKPIITSFCGVEGFTEHFARIAPVFTWKEHRNKGYASFVCICFP